MNNDGLVDRLKAGGWVKTASVERAMRSLDRALFVPPAIRRLAYVDEPLSIGGGQTISAPGICAFIAESLKLGSGMRVLDVGGGSGYQAAIAARIVGSEGRVYSVERVKELVQREKENLAAARVENVFVAVGDGKNGLPKHAPFDRVQVAAAFPVVPPVLLEQLSPNGLLVMPLGGRRQVLVRVDRAGSREELLGVVFVPLL